MDEIRINRIRSMMKDELSVLINRELKDPRVPTVVVTDVVITKDARQATVMISILSMDKDHKHPELMEATLEALGHAKGFLKRQLGHLMQLRMVPELIFKEDKGLENTLRVNEILKQLSDEKAAIEKRDQAEKALNSAPIDSATIPSSPKNTTAE
jgi:ribosome-binding factor A